MAKIKFSMIGGGWRSEFYIRCAKALPEVFEVKKVMLRNPDKAKLYSEKLDVLTTSSIDDIIADKPDYVIVSVPRKVALEYIEILFKAKIPVFCETPPGASVEDYTRLWELSKELDGKIQVTEQYFEWPIFGTWLNYLKNGNIGEVSNMTLSAAHGYHGVNIIRRFLGITSENCTIYGKQYSFPVTETDGRGGRIYDGKVGNVTRDRFTFEFDNGKTAFFDFSGVQYRSKIRTRKINIQGVRGEIEDNIVRYLNENNEVVELEMHRDDLGINSIQDFGHFGVMVGDKYYYKSMFPCVRLNDDELAVATIMYRMKEYIDTGKAFYNLEDALQDSYFSLLMDKALANPLQEIKSETQVWYQ